MTPEDFSVLLALHGHWLRTGGREGRRASLNGADSRGKMIQSQDRALIAEVAGQRLPAEHSSQPQQTDCRALSASLAHQPAAA